MDFLNGKPYPNYSWGSPHEGWSNSATWCFSLYFFQEEKNCDAFKSLVRRDGTVNCWKAGQLFQNALHGRAGLSMAPLDDDVEGDINVNEIVDNQLLEMRKLYHEAAPGFAQYAVYQRKKINAPLGKFHLAGTYTDRKAAVVFAFSLMELPGIECSVQGCGPHDIIPSRYDP